MVSPALLLLHTEPAYSNIKRYIDSHRRDFTSDQNQHIDEMIKMRDSYFNPPRCNQIKEIRSYYRDESGHEFSFAYTDGKAWSLCEEAREQGIPLPKYISYIVSQTPGFVAWTIETSAGRPVNVRRATYEEQGYAPTRGIQRGINRAISEENRKAEPMEVQITIADLKKWNFPAACFNNFRFGGFNGLNKILPVWFRYAW